MTLILSNEEIAQLLTMRIYLEALEEGHREQAEERAVNQLRYDTNMPLPERPMTWTSSSPPRMPMCR